MERLSDERKNELAVYWSKYKHQVEQQYGYDLIKEGLTLRHRCQTDGFWFAREILGYRAFGECHKELFSSPEHPDNFFVLKDPSAKSFKDFAEADKGLHDRLLFLPRGGFKSTADICDCIQYFLCWPSIRISIMTGTVSLAEEFTGIIKGHFALDPITDAKKKKEWDGWVYLEGTGRDGYSESLSDFWDNWESDHEEGDEKPAYVWACKKNHFAVADVSDITERIADNGYEDFDVDTLDGLDELKAAIEKFNDANKEVVSYEPDYGVAILLND